MSGHDNDSPADTSQQAVLLETLASCIGDLHTILDGFIEARTSALSGLRTRNALSRSLNDIDHCLKQFQSLQNAPAERLHRFVTAAMRTNANEIRAKTTTLAGILHDVQLECGKHKMRTKRPVRASEFLGFIQSDLDSLIGEMSK